MTNANNKKSEIAIEWIEANLYIPEGKFVGQPFRLAEFQKDILRLIYDNEHELGTRTAIISMPRKAAKTTICACIALLHLVGPFALYNSQLVSTALTRKQASLLFDLASKMVRFSPSIAPYVEIRRSSKELFCEDLGTVYQALSSDAGSNLGSSPALAIHDEVGAIQGPYSELIDAIETGAGAQANPLSVYISTQAATDGDLFSILIDDAKTGADPRTVVKVFQTPENVDAFSEEALTYHPAWDSFINQNELRGKQQEAKRLPVRESSFRNFFLNQRTEVNTPFINKTIWMENAQAPERDLANLDKEPWEGKDIYIGLDLSRNNDLTSLTIAYANDKDEKLSLIPYFYLPSDGIDEKSKTDRTPWNIWAKEELITLTPGRTVDYRFVAQQLLKISQKANIVGVAFDRYNINYFKRDLLEVGFSDQWITEHFVDFGQGFVSMAPAIRTLENLFLANALAHGNHPILYYCFNNVKVIEDHAKNRRFEKQSAERKIDGAITTVMAIGIMSNYGAIKKPKAQSYLATDDLFII